MHEKTPDEFVSRSILARQTIRMWDAFLSWIFKHSARSYRKGKRVLYHEEAFPEYISFFKKYSRYGNERGIVCFVTDFTEDIEIVQQTLHTIHSHYTDPKLREIISADMWGKAVSYRNMREGTSIPFSSQKNTEPSVFTLDTIFDLWKEIRAYGFISETNEAILLFRGTDISFLTRGGRASMLSDIDPGGPGLTVFEAAKDNLVHWLEQQKKAGRETRVIGHSLGGSLACYALITFPELFSRSCSSYATNYPGVNKPLFDMWKSLGNRPAFRGIVTEGDAVSKCGLLIDGTRLYSSRVKLAPMFSHEFLFGAEEGFSIYDVFIDAENMTRSRRFISRLHRSTSKVLYEMGLKHILPTRKTE